MWVRKQKRQSITYGFVLSTGNKKTNFLGFKFTVNFNDNHSKYATKYCLQCRQIAILQC